MHVYVRVCVYVSCKCLRACACMCVRLRSCACAWALPARWLLRGQMIAPPHFCIRSFGAGAGDARAPALLAFAPDALVIAVPRPPRARACVRAYVRARDVCAHCHEASPPKVLTSQLYGDLIYLAF